METIAFNLLYFVDIQLMKDSKHATLLKFKSHNNITVAFKNLRSQETLF